MRQFEVALPFLVLGAMGCLSFEVSRDVVSRAVSPSGDVEAILVETNGGATTSFGYEIHVVPYGEEPSDRSEVAYLYGATRSEGAYGVNLRWTKRDTLSVEFLEAREIVRHSPTVIVEGQEFRVEVVSGVQDLAAPPGGMLHNLERGTDPR